VRASNEAIVRRDGDGEKVGIGREGGERIPGFEVPELERLVGGSGERAAAIRQLRLSPDHDAAAGSRLDRQLQARRTGLAAGGAVSE
jgi:hypothetical protein